MHVVVNRYLPILRSVAKTMHTLVKPPYEIGNPASWLLYFFLWYSLVIQVQTSGWVSE